MSASIEGLQSHCSVIVWIDKVLRPKQTMCNPKGGIQHLHAHQCRGANGHYSDCAASLKVTMTLVHWFHRYASPDLECFDFQAGNLAKSNAGQSL